MVLRNHKGEAIVGMAGLLDNVLDATTAEALALLRGLEFLEKLGCQSVCIESDSLELIQACTGVIEIWSPYSAILAECFLKASTMNIASLQLCPRDANQVAHELAKHAYQMKVQLEWDGDTPDFILPFVVIMM